MNMQCPICADADLIHDTRDVQYTYKGESTVFDNITADFCPACGEFILDADEARQFGGLVRGFNKQVNASFVDPKFIADVRQKLNLDQKQAAEIFGGGHNAFSRYENGRVKPPLPLVLLFKVLDRHPDLLTEITQH
jgi:HTH-type transcriptional regulator/antitoxin MqsA